MNLKTVIMIIALGCVAQLQAEWWADVFLFADDNGTWKVLLRLDPTTNMWTDFKEEGTQTAKRAYILAAEMLRQQIGGDYYKLSAEQIKPHWSEYVSTYGSKDYVHFVIVNFIPGKELYTVKIQGVSDDFVWIPLQDLLTQNNITRTHKTRQQTSQHQVDSEVQTILQQNKQKIDAMLGIAPTQHVPQQPPTPGQGKWNIAGAIFFYNKGAPYYEFTNFYEKSVIIDNKKWPTTEHYYQAQKFTDENLREQIRKLKTAREAFSFARANKQSVRADWQNVNLDIMLKAVRAKFSQNQKLKDLLLGTGDKILVENAGKNDDFFGAGADFNGHNHLGRILIQVREELQGAPKPRRPQEPQQPVQPAKQSEDLVNQLQTLAQALKNVECLLAPKTEENCWVS